MRFMLTSLVVLGLFTGDLCAQGDGRHGGGRFRERDSTPVELKNFTYQKVEFDTKDLTAGKAHYGIYLPAGYADPANANKKYPWVIWLHGMREDERDFHQEGARILDDTVTSGKFTPFVFVAASALTRTLYMNGEPEGNIADLITKDLVADVQSKFHVATDRSQRAIMGVSLGGMAALRFAMTNLDLFGTVAVHSAAVFPEDPGDLPPQHLATYQRFGERSGWYALLGNPIDKAKFAAFNPTAIAHTLKDVKGLRIYFDAGTDDRYGFGPANQHLADVLKAAGIPFTFKLIQGGQHSWGGGTVQKALVDSLTFVNESFTMQTGQAGATPGATPAPAKSDDVKKDEAKQSEAKKEGGGN
jgi:enterochelin esterase-like enzyme